MNLAPRMSHAGRLPDTSISINLVVTGKGIVLQHTAELGQMGLRMLALPIGRVGKPYRRRRCRSRIAVVPHIDSEPAWRGLKNIDWRRSAELFADSDDDAQSYIPYCMAERNCLIIVAKIIISIAGESVMQDANTMPERRMGPKRDVYQRRSYAAHRAAIALERAIRITSIGPFSERDQALRWMKLWVAFAASRHHQKKSVPTANAA